MNQEAKKIFSAPCTTSMVTTSEDNGDGTFNNPVIFADVPDPDVIRVGDTYYMTSTTMHMAPGVPVMKSTDLVNWEIVNYVYDQLMEDDARALKHGKNDYAQGSWASTVRYDKYEKLFYVEFSCNTTNQSHFFVTEDIENGPWHRTDTVLCYDAGLLFVDNEEEQRCEKYIIYSKDVTDPAYTDENGKEVDKYYHKSTCMRTMSVDANRDITLGEEVVLLEYPNCEFPAEGLHAEGVHAYYLNGYYYLFIIQGVTWQRQEICWRSKTLEPESFECRKVFVGNVVDEEGKDYMPFTGIAQGGIVDTADGRWYSMLFEDYGAVGRIPVLIPMYWSEDGWPIIGNDGTSVDRVIKMPHAGSEKKSIVVSDEFDNGTIRKIIDDKKAGTGVTAGLTVEELQALIEEDMAQKQIAQEDMAQEDMAQEDMAQEDMAQEQIAENKKQEQLIAGDSSAGSKLTLAVEQNEYGYNGSNLKLEWQWNHNPNNNLWSLTDREGYLRLKSGLLTDTIQQARNTLTQRTYGPVCGVHTAMEFSGMKDGDVAGLTSFQNRYGFVGVKMEAGKKYLVMHRATAKDDAVGIEPERILLEDDVKRICLRVVCDFRDNPEKQAPQSDDKAYFYYSFDEGETWTQIGDVLAMAYDWPHFVGQRLGLFYYSTKQCGGWVDFDYFRLESDAEISIQ